MSFNNNNNNTYMNNVNTYIHIVLRYISYFVSFFKLLSYISLFVLLYIYLNKDIYSFTSNSTYLNVSYLFGLFGIFNIINLFYKPNNMLYSLLSFPFTGSLPFLGIKLFMLEYMKQDSIMLKRLFSINRTWKTDEKMDYILGFLSKQNKTLSSDELNKLVNENITLAELKKKVITTIHANENKSLELEKIIFTSNKELNETQEHIKQLNLLYTELKSKYSNLAINMNNENTTSAANYLGFMDVNNLYKFVIAAVLVLLGAGSIVLIMNYLFFNNSIWNNMLSFLKTQHKQDVVSVNLHSSNMKTTELSISGLDELTNKLSATMEEQGKIKKILGVTNKLQEKTCANVEKLETGLNNLIIQHNELGLETREYVDKVLEDIGIQDDLIAKQMFDINDISQTLKSILNEDVIKLLKTISVSGISNLDEDGIQLVLKMINVICSISKTEEGKQSLIKYISTLNEINNKP